MKPRILILMHYMELGGAETSLIGLLGALDPEKVDVDLFIHSHRGPLMKYIPSWVNLLPEMPQYAVIESPITEALRRRQLGVVIGRVIAKLRHKRYKKSANIKAPVDASELQYVADSVERFLPDINPNVDFDLCISYLTPHNYALSKVHAKKRLAWIHTDYATVHINVEQELAVWSAFDKIASISPDVTESFLHAFPELKDKIIEIENIMPSEMILSRAEELDVRNEIPQNNGHNLLSIGRYCHAKNYDNVPDIALQIVKGGISDLKWYIIGYGPDEGLIQRKITEAGMENHVILLGKKDNPYPYIKACDIYVQPSRYEGKSITVREAQLLGKPVVITDYPTAKSQISDGVNGFVVPLDNDGCAKGIFEVLNNPPRLKEIVSNLTIEKISGQSEIEKIYQLL